MSILDCTNQNIRSGSELKGFGSDSLYVFGGIKSNYILVSKKVQLKVKHSFVLHVYLQQMLLVQKFG